jgi:two-component system response regulator FlrC
MRPILVVDDDSEMRSALKDAIQKIGYSAVVCEDGYDAINKLSQSYYSLLITDMKMPRMDGLSLLKEIRKRGHNLPALVITGFGTIENAVDTMKEGAIDYLLKPFSFDALKTAIEAIIRKTSLEKEIVSKNSEMQKIINLAGNLAMSDITVLIYGESGTGKELLARYIHKNSKRADKPFVAVNCAAIPDNLLESELFGYEKGAFTGAIERRKGKFELANGGTMLLDEIGEMSMTLQAKLLRVLQEREIDRIGGKEPIPIDVRVIATTNRDLERECSEGRFREDLYYRLNVFPIKVPSLRERPEDIEILAEHFLNKFSLNYGKDIEGFEKEAIEYLMNRRWRGNVRELENVIQRAVFVCSGRYISIKDLMIDDNSKEDSKTIVNGSLKDLERELILKTLKDVGGNKTKAAKILGLSVRTIRNKLNEYGKIFPNEVNF